MSIIKGGLTAVAVYQNSLGTAAGIFEAVLKESYASKVYEQLNNEVFVLSVMEKKKAQWSGKTCVIPLHIGRNTSVRWAAEGTGAIFTGAPDNQDWAKLHVDVKYVYGHFGFTGQAMEVCKGKDAIIDACEEEMSKLKDDIKNECDQRMFAGRRVLGFLNERRNKASNNQWEFSGDLQRVRALRDIADGAAIADDQGLIVNLVRMDDYTMLFEAGPTAMRCRITAENLTAGLITLVSESTGPIDTRPQNWRGAGNPTSSPAIPDGVGIAVILAERNAGAAVNFRQPAEIVTAIGLTPHGIFDNLAEYDWFTLSRIAALGAGAAGVDGNQTVSPFGAAAISETHSIILTNNPTGDHGRTSMNPTRLQMLEDEMQFLSGGKYDEIVMSPLMQSEYVNLGNQTASLITTTEAAKKLDLGFSGLSFNNVAIKTARNCPRGLMIFLTKDTWGFYELCPLKFSDRGGGAIMEPVARGDAYEGMMKWYYNLACTSPKKNAILVGIDYPGATTL